MNTTTKSTAELQLELMFQSKKALIARARIAGWRGDEARASKLQLVTYLAANQDKDIPATAAQRETQAGKSSPRPDDAQRDQAAQAKSHGESGGGGGEGAQDGGEQSEQQQQGGAGSQDDKQQGDGAQGDQDGEQSEGDGAQDDKQQGKQSEGEQQQGDGAQDQDGKKSDGKKSDGKKSDGKKSESNKQQQGEQSEGANKQQQGEQQQGDGSQGDQQQQQDDEPKAPDNKQWRKMLESAGITSPHPMLRKIYSLLVVGKQNVMLYGEVGTGKTTIGSQLARLLDTSFGFVSCSSGMSESQLTGWLLPRNGGNFEYSAAPLVTITEGGGVFLWDEFDRQDAGTGIVANSLLANGVMSLPHRLEKPFVQRHAAAYYLAAVNALNGADEKHTAAVQQDAAALDRFYTVKVDFDESIALLPFRTLEKPKAKSWAPTQPADEQSIVKRARAFRAAVMHHGIERAAGVRMYHKLFAACKAGVSLNDATDDLLLAFSPDETRNVKNYIKANEGGM